MSYKITCEVRVPVTLFWNSNLTAESIKKALISDLEGWGSWKTSRLGTHLYSCRSALENVVVMSNEDWSYCMENPGTFLHFY